MSSVLKLVHTQAHPQRRACNTCRHGPKIFAPYSLCKATGGFIESERAYPHKACGSDGKLWEPVPPRRGLVGWLKVWVVGE